MTTTPDSTAGMIQARRSDSAAKRQRIKAALERMQQDGTPITFSHVARQAQVSTWLVYAPGVRETIETARADQQTRPDKPRRRQPRRSASDLETDLALARAEISKLRAERDDQQQRLRLALGARLDNLAKADLITRVDELTRHNDDLAATTDRLHADNRALHKRVTELEDDLAAARTSLRRMIRAENRPAEG